ncbi:MAG: inactive transglutaminase family protein [Gammaproteobacteria bacterium]
MSKTTHVKILALVLILAGTSLCAYKAMVLGLPLFPAEEIEIWSVEAKLKFHAKRVPVKVRLSLPSTPPGFLIVDENFVSGKYGLSIQDEENNNRQAEWAIRRASGDELLYYHLQLAPDQGGETDKPSNKKSAKPRYPKVPEYPEYQAAAVEALLEEVRQKSADTGTFTRELILRLNSKNPDENVKLLKSQTESEVDRVRQLMYILAGARIPSRMIDMLFLSDGMRHGSLTPWIQVHDGSGWLTFNPETGESGIPPNALLWQIGDRPPFEVEGGKRGELEFSIRRLSQEPLMVAERRARKMNSRIMEFSLFSLPIQTQNVYKILFMVPMGAMFIVFLRNIIGFKTFGTFMPILIALAFRETELLWGVLLFSLLVALGLLLRFYLEYLQLLLVPRLAAVLIIVILLMTIISVISHRLGIDRGLSVALFPMVILSMTIERMSLVWEEHGAAEALQQGLGSLAVASIGYLVMRIELLNHVIFVFPELLLVVLAATLLLGRYTGYRITELWRFRSALHR